MIKTSYEKVGESWQIILEGDDAAAVQCEINRLDICARFIGPRKVGDKYVAKGMMVREEM